MSEQVVKRYDIDRYGARECDNGYWIHAASYDALLSLNAELLEALEAYAIEDKVAQGFGGGVGGEVQQRAESLIAKARSQS